MVRHFVSWAFREEFSDEENARHAQKIKRELEGLRDVIPGIVEMRVVTELLPESNAGAMLISAFDSEEALRAYQSHPAHRAVSDFVRSVMTGRRCVDFIEDGTAS